MEKWRRFNHRSFSTSPTTPALRASPSFRDSDGWELVVVADDGLLVHDFAAVNAARAILNQNAIWEMALAVDHLTVGQIVHISAGPRIRKKNPVVQEFKHEEMCGTSCLL
jgi:hypothetical protein